MAPPQRRSRWANITGPWDIIWLSFRLHFGVLVELLRREGLPAITRLGRVRKVASAKLFSATSGGFIAYENTTVVPSLVRAAEGVILDLGPGPGNQIHRFDASRVEYIYGVEPNANFASDLEAKSLRYGLRDRYRHVVCGIEDSRVLREEGVTEGSLDTVLCIQVLCAVEDPKIVMKELYKLLKPGGKFIFWEHGCSRDPLSAVVQAIWNPAWSTFVGCHLTRKVLSDILSCGEWENPEEIQEPEDPYGMLPRIQGVLIKKA